MLDIFSITTSFLALLFLSFPPGYLILNIFSKQFFSKFQFFSIVPLYLAFGLTVQIFISFLAGTFIISSIIPVMTALGSLMLIIVFLREKIKFNHLKSLRNNYGNIFSILVIVFFFIYFAQIPIEHGWPPIGDAMSAAQLTSIVLYQGHVPHDYSPLSPHRLIYPVGFHTFSANFSSLIGLFPAEGVWMMGIFFIILISTASFTLSCILTKSYWLSLPIPFSILIAHSSRHLEQYVGGYIFNGVIPNLYGYLITISIITLMHVWFEKKGSIKSISTILLITFFTLFVTYPAFGFHVIIVVAIYIILRKVNVFRTYFVIVKKSLYQAHNQSMQFSLKNPNYEEKIESDNRFFIYTLSFGILAAIIIISAITGLFFYYNELIFFNVNYLSSFRDDLGISNRAPLFFSDWFFTLIFTLGIASSFALVLIKWKLEPIAIIFLVLVLILFADIVLISPQRTLPFLSLLSWIMIAFTISELRSKKIKNHKFFGYIIIFGFMFTALYLEYPHVVYNVSDERRGWFLDALGDFPVNYDVSIWLTNNVNPNDLILNDRSYASLFLHTFRVFNLSHHYGVWYLEPQSQELSLVWQEPYYKDQAYSLLKKYNVKYVVLMDEYGYRKFLYIDGVDGYFSKQYSNEEYKTIFRDYEFLKPVYTNGDAIVYSVVYN